MRWEAELEREVAPGHVLMGLEVAGVGRRRDRDDALFALSTGGWAIVHLTWTGKAEADPRWPSTQTFRDPADLRARFALDALDAD